jgi:hypothetical protein
MVGEIIQAMLLSIIKINSLIHGNINIDHILAMGCRGGPFSIFPIDAVGRP